MHIVFSELEDVLISPPPLVVSHLTEPVEKYLRRGVDSCYCPLALLDYPL